MFSDRPDRSCIVPVVEDEPLVRMMAVDYVEDAGYRVIEASNADEAVRILEGRTDVRLVFTDVDMPGSIDGLKLAAAVRHRWPPIKIVVTSGHHRAADMDLPAEVIFLPKPYRAAQIVAALDQLAA